ncbi:HAD-IA family hydrolase [Streptomyces sp. ICBB 8177]|uniref:HAD family hydrolase n=1 Tax=Streptomyces sp. ICBB 8177 TaxID=563922 RepID=UPI000D682D02|nr:HAD-IA family hydrolase [Streptomyces sp. ICBB 8177]PWI41718.1 hydrolase [Streptomyces sp. ICBB 8177]
MTIKGCLFDFSGTTFRVEPTVTWLRGALAEADVTAPEEDVERYARLLEEAGALPGGLPPRAVPDHLRAAWEVRDLDADRHRTAFVALAREVALPWPQLYDVLYERHMSPRAWRPYADTAGVLAALRERGVRTGVLSNIGWDLRPVLRAYGVDRDVHAVVLSYEEGVQKPDPKIFRIGCERLGLAPQEVLMVGDSAEADGGATAIGCAFHQVEHLPVDRRPDGLRPVLDLVGRLGG